jgi:hypothetical protein
LIVLNGLATDAGGGLAEFCAVIRRATQRAGVVGYLSGLDKGLMASLGMQGGIPRPDWMVEIEFPWRIMFGTITTFSIAMMFRTPIERQQHLDLAVQGKE